jgi:hypothetical protein
MELEGTKEEIDDGEHQERMNQAGRPPPIILTSATNLLQLQKNIRFIVRCSFELRNTKNGTDRCPGRKGGTAAAVRKGIPHNHVDLPPLDTVEATGVCITVGNSEVLLAALYKSPGRAWSDADITELLSSKTKSILAGDLNAKNPLWDSTVSKTSGDKLLHLFDVNQFESSAPQCSTHYSPSGNGDVLDIVAQQNIRVSDVIVSDILDSDHLPVIFHILDHVKIRNLSDPIEKFTDWVGFKALPLN